MDAVRLKDGEGHEMLISKYKDTYYPTFITAESIERVKELEMRSEDIVVIAYPKAGTHWIHEIIRMLVSGKAEPVEGRKEDAFLENPWVPQEHLAQLPSPRVLNTHLRCSSIPIQVKEKKSRLIIVIRNPKDTVVSQYHHTCQIKAYEYEGSIHGFLSLWMQGKVAFGSWFDYHVELEQFIQENTHLPIHVVYYQDMIEDLPKAIRELAEFLEITCSVELVDGIADKAVFKNLKQSKDEWENKQTLMKSIFRSDKYEMFRKGIVGDWKNYFTVTENANFDQLYSERMSNSSLRIRFEL